MDFRAPLRKGCAQIAKISSKRFSILLQAEKDKIEERLRRIRSVGGVVKTERVRRPYPPVLPKYKNPKKPTEIWSGRGKQPLWLREQLKTGERLDQFLIAVGRRGSGAAR